MTQDHTPSHIRIGATVLMVFVSAQTLNFGYGAYGRAIRFCFTEPARWNTHWRVDPGTMIETGTRIGYFAIWGFIISASMACFLVGLFLLNRVRRGLVFTETTANGIRALGLMLGFTMLIDQVFQAFDPWLITRFNAEPHPVRWVYDPSDIKSLVMAAILFLFGWVMRESIAVERENREFV